MPGPMRAESRTVDILSVASSLDENARSHVVTRG